MSTLNQLLDDVKKRLVDTGTRSRLVHVNREAKRGNFINIINEKSEEIFKILKEDGKKMKFLAKSLEKVEDDEFTDITFEELTEAIDPSRYTDLILETPLTADALQKRLVKLAHDAKIALDEQGVNILYLAMGFLQWYESESSSVKREAPLILLPVQMVRNQKTSRYELLYLGDDIATNEPIKERLMNEEGLLLPSIPDNDNWSPESYFDQVEQVISSKPRWSLDRDGMQLGFFSFAKLLMHHDLDPENWSHHPFEDNEILMGLVRDGFEAQPSLFKEDQRLDEVISPDQLLHVIDADSSQTKVIEAVRSGQNLVVQGPPGTGKSQTITNILAAAVYDGKKVLFVAEKMAALSVVYERMIKVGLADLCLELHSRSANKRAVIDELGRTLRQQASSHDYDSQALKLTQTRDRLNNLVDTLHEPLPDCYYSPFDILSKLLGYVGKAVPVPNFDATQFTGHSLEEDKHLQQLMQGYIECLEQRGPMERNPYAGSENIRLQPTERQRLIAEIEQAAEQLGAWFKYQFNLEGMFFKTNSLTLASGKQAINLLEILKQPPAGLANYLPLVEEFSSEPSFAKGITTGQQWGQARAQFADSFQPQIWDVDLLPLRAKAAKASNSWFAKVFGGYRGLKAQLALYSKTILPSAPAQVLALVDALIQAQQLKQDFDGRTSYLQACLKQHWDGSDSNFEAINQVYHWWTSIRKISIDLTAENLQNLLTSERFQALELKEVEASKSALLNSLNSISEKLSLGIWEIAAVEKQSLEAVEERIEGMQDQKHYTDWIEYLRLRIELENMGCSSWVEQIDQGIISLPTAVDVWNYAMWETRWVKAQTQRSELAKLDHIDRHELVAMFMEQENQRAWQVQGMIRDKHLNQLPKGAAGEMGIIRGEIAKKRSHMAIRKLMSNAATMIQRIKPVFLMSPISVAQYLPPESVEFDLLVIDEASQVKPQDALGSIARAKKIIVVGDQKQLPPTSFFDRMSENEDTDSEDDSYEGAKVADMESILSLCEARGLNREMLSWHYRSRDPSLITVSNIEFYERKLILPPCPTQEDHNYGLKFAQVPGIYSSASRGGDRPRTNRIEAQAIVDRLIEVATVHPEWSVGIVTFSKTQADMMTELLEFNRRNHPILDDFLADNKNEEVFVKNIENVQGDERDLILISVGYGPHEPNGQLTSMNFGPINSEGGERRLNVMFSRARLSCEVFASFDPSQINLSKVTKQGPKVLKKFLEYAQHRRLPEVYESVGEPDSDFEIDVANVIRSFGYEAQYQVGSAGFKLDIAVKHPEQANRYILAVECDGATYHSALWARERDRLRQQVLEGFGWKFYRIWSTDWFHRRDHEIQRLRQALEQAKNLGENTALRGSNVVEKINELEESVELRKSQTDSGDTLQIPADDGHRHSSLAISLPDYVRIDLQIDADIKPHEVTVQELQGILVSIAEIEGPVHSKVIASRYAEAFSVAKVGIRIMALVDQGLASAADQGLLVQQSDFWGTSEQFNSPVARNRSKQLGLVTQTEYIASAEIKSVIEAIMSDAGAIDTKELASIVAKTFGFKRSGPSFTEKVRLIVDGSLD